MARWGITSRPKTPDPDRFPPIPYPPHPVDRLTLLGRRLHSWSLWCFSLVGLASSLYYFFAHHPWGR